MPWVAHRLRATDLIISGGSCAQDRVTLPLYPVASLGEDGGARTLGVEVAVAVAVDDMEVAVGRRARRSVTGEGEVTDLCHSQIQPAPKRTHAGTCR